MLKRIITIILCQALVLEPTFASSQNFTYVDRYAYDFVTSTCHLRFDALATLIESTKEDSQEYFYLLNPATYLQDNSYYFYSNNIFLRKGIGKNIDRLLSSGGYFAGLKACFPNSEYQRNLYTQNLLLFDAFGKLATLAIVGTIAVLTAKGLSFAGRKMVVSPTVKILRRAGVSELYLQKTPYWMGKAGEAAFTGLIITSIGLKIKAIKKEREEQKRFEINPNESIEDLNQSIASLDENLKLLGLVHIVRDAAKTPSEHQKAAEVFTQQKQNVVYYLNQILGHKELSGEQREKYKSLFLALDQKNKDQLNQNP